jgi:eukaryotic-like serine/threonine-protein kinase
VTGTPPFEGPRTIGRYLLHGEIASGGMAVVHFGRLLGPVGFSRTVAIKRMHTHLARDPGFRAMFLDEARLAARIRHSNVVPILDVLEADDELYLVMEYVHGESFDWLLKSVGRREQVVPVPISTGIVRDALHGLHAAHEATSERGRALGIVHRDVSPHNILVGADGLARVHDFGVAKAQARVQLTAEGQLKGKIAYMAPEQVDQGGVDRRADVWSASVVLWEALTGKRLFSGDHPAQLMKRVLSQPIPWPRELAGDVPAELEQVVMRGLERDPELRFGTAREMALALDALGLAAAHHAVGSFVQRVAARALETRAARISAIEGSETASGVAVLVPGASALASAPETEALNAQTLVATSVTNAETRALPPAPAPTSPRRWPAFVLVALLAAAGGASVALLSRGGEPIEPLPVSAAREQPDSPPGPAAGPEPAPEPAAALELAESIASSQPEPAPKSTARSKGARRPPAPAGKAPVPRADCNPPYTTTNDGVRVPKIHCL